VTAAASRRILVVAFAYPPAPYIGGNRWLAISEHLRARGHEVTVLSTSAFGTLEDDAARDVHRTRDLMASPAIRAILRRPPLLVEGGTATVSTTAPALLTKVLVPDGHLASWVPFATAAARRLLRSRRYDAVVTTTPYESAHLVGLACSRSAAWVADFRDGWVFDSHREPFVTGAQRALDRSLERRVARTADAVTAATRPIAEDFRDRLGVDAVHVPNGWDPAWDAEVQRAEPPALEGDRLNLVYTGTLSGGWGRSPRALLRALRVLSDEPEVAGRLRLVIAGRQTESDERDLRELASPLVRHVGVLSRPAARALQRRADGLVLITSRNRSEATGKLFEYLGAGRPVLALAEGNEAERIVRETAAGITVAPDDEHAIAATLREVAAGSLQRAYAPRGLEEYIYPGPALKVEQVIERAIAQRAARVS
jgi:glycosyltransferase involved in cell wall biosynthesis